MFFDLNVPLPSPGAQVPAAAQLSKKAKQKLQNAYDSSSTPLVFTSSQISAIESRIDLLVHLGYTLFGLNQTVQSKIDSRTHVNWIQGLLPKLKKRSGIAFLKRLTIVLDEESEKGNGLNPQNATILTSYDILSLRPTTQTSFYQACLTHSTPSPHTAHIISVPVTLPRLPFHLKHTLIRTALKNGAVFEIDYAGAVNLEAERRNWWGGSREIVRVTKGKGILLSGGTNELMDLRAPRDAANLITLLGIPQNMSYDAITTTPKAVVLRAQFRKTYRSTLSEPKLNTPSIAGFETLQVVETTTAPPESQPDEDFGKKLAVHSVTVDAVGTSTASTLTLKQGKRRHEENKQSGGKNKKRTRDF